MGVAAILDRDHFSNFSFPHPKEAPYEIWAKLAQRLQRRSRLKILTDGRIDGRTDARTDDRRKVITIAHPEQSSGELKTVWAAMYSRLSLSRTRLSRITAYLEVKIWSLF